jgi:hypothetical protein
MIAYGSALQAGIYTPFILMIAHHNITVFDEIMELRFKNYTGIHTA